MIKDVIYIKDDYYYWCDDEFVDFMSRNIRKVQKIYDMKFRERGYITIEEILEELGYSTLQDGIKGKVLEYGDYDYDYIDFELLRANDCSIMIIVYGI